MMNNKRIIAVFDFDGTLTSKDTFIEFILFSFGKLKFFLGVLLFLPLIILMKLNLYPNWKCKEKIFSWFLKKMPYVDFKDLGIKFITHIQTIQREPILFKLQKHIVQKDDVYVISASINEWIRPYCDTIGVKCVLATEIEIDANGLLTGSFLTKNCYGQEKVNRLLSIEPNREDYYLVAYGDSKGDKEMLSFADQSFYV